MKISEFMAVKRPGRPKKGVPALTPDQKTANRELYLQELADLGDAATTYFKDFWVGPVRRSWVGLPVETWRDISDAQVDFVLKNIAWFKAAIERSGRLNEQLT